VAAVKAEGSSQYNPGWHEALSVQSLALVSEAVAKSALLREESRGAHTRIDFEGERPEGLAYNVIVRKGNDGRMEVMQEKRSEPPAELARIAHAQIEELDAEVAAERSGEPVGKAL